MSSEENRAHLLVVDDEASVRSALRRVLRKENYRMTCVDSAAEALEALQNDPPDVIISDHLMPEMTGLELMKRVRLRYPHVARIVLTGQAEMETVIAAINEGEVFRFLRKPWQDEEVKLAVHLAVAHAREGKTRLEDSRESTPRTDDSRANRANLRKLEAAFPGIADLDRDTDGAILIDDEELDAS